MSATKTFQVGDVVRVTDEVAKWILKHPDAGDPCANRGPFAVEEICQNTYGFFLRDIPSGVLIQSELRMSAFELDPFATAVYRRKHAAAK